MNSKRDQYDSEDSFIENQKWDNVLENLKFKDKPTHQETENVMNSHRPNQPQACLNPGNSRTIPMQNPGFFPYIPNVPLLNPCGGVIQTPSSYYTQIGYPISNYPGYQVYPQQLWPIQQITEQIQPQQNEQTEKKLSTKKKKKKSSGASDIKSQIKTSPNLSKNKLTEESTSKDDFHHSLDKSAESQDKTTHPANMKHRVEIDSTDSLKKFISSLDINAKKLSTKCQDMFIKIINLNNSDLEKWEFAMNIQKIIEQSLSKYEISATMKLLSHQGFEKFSNTKFGNYIIQSLVKKLSAEDLAFAWTSLSTFSIMISEYGNRVIQLSLNLLLDFKNKKYEDMIINTISTYYDFLAYNKYGTYILQNYLCHSSSPNIQSLVTFIEENFYSLSFHVNGIHLVKKYITHIKGNQEEITKIFERFVKPHIQFLMIDKYCHYLVCLFIEEFSYLRKESIIQLNRQVKSFKDKYSRKVVLLILELYDEVSSILINIGFKELS